MRHLIIADLSDTTGLDRSAMQAIRGGTYTAASCFPVVGLSGFGGNNSSKHDFSFDAQQLTQQTQENCNTNGNNVAFASGIQSCFKPTQTNASSIKF
jgi:hypothetical protein